MVDRTDELREDIEERRDRIGHTVDQIENRVSPSRVAARTTHNMSRRMSGWKDRIMGDDQTGADTNAKNGGALSEAGRKVAEAPDTIRRSTTGNPVAAGLVAFGGGMLVGSLFPGTDAERRAVKQVEPVLREGMPEAKEMGRQAVDDVKDAVRESADEMKEMAAESGQRLRQDVQDTRDDSTA
ncbi:MAG: DUF3618 domain-containing protein [Acidimicrobiia bacterium]